MDYYTTTSVEKELKRKAAKIDKVAYSTQYKGNKGLFIDKSHPEITNEEALLAPAAETVEVPYTELVGLLTQVGTADPTFVTLYNNTEITLSFSRTAEGLYKCSFSSEVDLNKFTIVIDSTTTVDTGANVTGHIHSLSSESCFIQSITTDIEHLDGLLGNTPLSVKIYK